MPTWAVAILAAVPSGFLGAWFGAWLQTRHDRIERLRDRRIAAADALVQAWAAALFAIDDAIREAQTLIGPKLISEAQAHVTSAVKLSVRVDLLFGSTSLTSAITNVVRDATRIAIEELKRGDADAARRHHEEA